MGRAVQQRPDAVVERLRQWTYALAGGAAGGVAGGESAMVMTDQELFEFSGDHLHYELWRLLETRLWLRKVNAGTDVVVKNAVIESFTVHARSITSFLFYPPSRNDDVTAQEYVSNVSAWRNARGLLPALLKVVMNRTGKEIAHLTTRRLPPGDQRKVWDPERIVAALASPLRLLVSHTPSTRLDVTALAMIGGFAVPAAPAAHIGGIVPPVRGTDISTP